MRSALNPWISSRESILKLIEYAQGIGNITNLINAAGVSPSQAPVSAILKVDLYGTAVLLEEFGKVIAEGGSGVIVSSQSGHRLGALSEEQNRELATTPTEELLELPFLKEITDTLKAYQYFNLDELDKSSVFTVGPENTKYAQYFDGKSYLNMLSLEQVIIGNVTFGPGCRNHWHIHHAAKGGGQILLVTAGRGWYQEWGKSALALKAGDVVNIPAGVKHWHGAAKASAFQHLAIEVPGEETSTEWCEPVDEAEYGKL